MTVRPFDALLLVSFGGPEKTDDVVPFLENVTAGRGIPRERLVEVGEHYFALGGRSPINDQNRALLAAIQDDLRAHDIDLPVYWGNRNWDPYLRDTAEKMVADGVQHAVCFTTSAYSSYSSCRQYREDLYPIDAELPITLSKLRPYFNHPGFIEPIVDGTRAALAGAPADTRVVFVTHSIPDQMNDASGGPGMKAYEHQHQAVAELVAERLALPVWSLAYCSRSGSPQVPWLEPDINDHLAELAESGVTSVAVVPIGFVSDHMEVVYDLDTEAAATAADLAMDFVRVPTAGVDPRFVAMVRDLVLERAAAERGEPVERAAVGLLPPRPDHCAVDCCVNPRSSRPVLA